MKAVVADKRSVTWKGCTFLPGDEIPDLPKEEEKRLLLKGAILREKTEKKPAKKGSAKGSPNGSPNGSGDKEPEKDEDKGS